VLVFWTWYTHGNTRLVQSLCATPSTLTVTDPTEPELNVTCRNGISGVGVGAGVFVGVAVGVTVGVAVGVGVTVGVGGTGVTVGVAVTVGVFVAVGVAVGVFVGTPVGKGVGVGATLNRPVTDAPARGMLKPQEDEELPLHSSPLHEPN
jgi:hypothetical protein